MITLLLLYAFGWSLPPIWRETLPYVAGVEFFGYIIIALVLTI